MTVASSNEQTWFQRWYTRWAPLMVTFSLVAATLSVIGVFALQLVNNRQDEQFRAEQAARSQDNERLISCFDKFATNLAGGLPPVRSASAKRDTALRDALVGPKGLKAALVRLSAGKASADDLFALLKALDAYASANQKLNEVRSANPYPPPPSKFCTLPD